MPDITGVIETALYVDDLERSAEFYARVLGLRTIFDGRPRLLAMSVADRQVLLLFLKGASVEPAALPGGIVPPHDGNGQLHVAFGIDASGVDGWTERLHALGVPLESRVTWSLGGTSLYFRDPDGHAVELITPGCWTIY